MSKMRSKSTQTTQGKLNRYTNLMSLFDILQRRKLTLLNPAYWDDRNDAYAMSVYRERSGLRTLLAICFSQASETYHHWRVFAGSEAGVCIEFDKAGLMQYFDGAFGIRFGDVRYSLLENLKTNLQDGISNLPFLKRKPYKDEREFRIIFQDNEEELEAKAFSIELSSIRRISLSPWLPKQLSDTAMKLIGRMKDCASIEVIRSSLIENEQWKGAIRDS